MHPAPPTPRSPSVRRALLRITIGGCLAMVYISGTTAPFFADFLREIGASEFQFGLVGGIPMVMFCMQFFGALTANRLARRKPLFMVCLITGRVLYLVVAMVPLITPGWSEAARVWTIVALLGVSSALMNYASPIWFAWMADLIPRRVLNSYWGVKQGWMFLTWAGSMLSIAGYAYLCEAQWGIDVPTGFALLTAIAVLAGVIDILLFANIPEPRNVQLRDVPVMKILAEPWQHEEFRSFVPYTVFRGFGLMMAAAFFQIYLLDAVGMPNWQATVIWCSLGVGIFVSSKAWGRMADRHGHRPIMIIADLTKPLVPIAYILISPEHAFVALIAFHFFDGVINSGMMVATNGYMMKIAPQRNRSMYVATMMGLSGLGAGLGAIVGGALLARWEQMDLNAFGRDWNHYHVIFAVALLFRLATIPISLRVREAASSKTATVLMHMRGAWPFQFFRFPTGLYRNPR